MKIIKYQLVTEKYETDMDERVMGYIKLGWQPLGGITHSSTYHGGPGFAQAMVMYEQLTPIALSFPLDTNQ